MIEMVTVVYAIYGTWYHIHSHVVTQPYVGLVNSSIYSFYILPLSRVVLFIILLFTVRGVSHLTHRYLEYSKINTSTSYSSTLPETL